MTVHNHQRFPVPTHHAKTKAVHVIIESPKGSRNKYVYDEKSGLLRLKKVLPAGMSFPFNFGFVPGTRGGDGDPLDAVILFDEPLVPGSFVRGRILGAILATQKRKAGYIRNDRLIVEPILDSAQPKLCNFQMVLNEMEKFFVTSHQLEGRDFKVIRCVGRREAGALVAAAIT
jgi:inorganic pyrophosphatase